MTSVELTAGQQEMKSRQSAEPTPIIVTVRRDGTRCFVQHRSESEALSQYIVAQALVLRGTLRSEQCDTTASLSEWDFPCIREAARFARELQGFVAPAVDTIDNWAKALKKQLTEQMARTLETEDEFMERIRKHQEEA